jgi:hypothetical protein
MKRDKPKLRALKYDNAPSHARLSCQRKAMYRSKGQAKAAATRSTRSLGSPVIVYRCPCCQFFHLTKRKPVR